MTPPLVEADNAAEAEARTYLATLSQRAEWHDLAFKRHVVRKPIAATLLGIIATTHAELTILCRHHHGPWPLGRVAGKIARLAPSAVVLLDGEVPALKLNQTTKDRI